jgi:cytochrome c553
MDQIMGARLIKWLAIISLSAAASAAFAEGDAAAGHKKNHSCTGCHGIPGWRTAFPEVYKVPKLGGQHAAYIIAALKGYKSGERKHGTMQAIAASLTEQDMADLAAYYATMAAK